jgi:branched-chain amino acid transport system permease protein
MKIRSIDTLVLVGFAVVPVIASVFNQPHYVTLFGRILVYAIAALSVSLLLGRVGLASFGHAMFLGIGAYSVGIASTYGINGGLVQWSVGIAAAGIIALVIGALSVRLTGLYFIMITLAFGEMFYFLASGLTIYGGDDGMTVDSRSTFGNFVNLQNETVLYYVILAALMLMLLFIHRLSQSRLGMIMSGIRSNEVRMLALGFPTFRYKLIAFVMSAMVCALSGLLLANLTDFVTAQYMTWERSGELLIMVILGGMTTLLGPIIGATALLLFEDVFSAYTDHWAIILGPVLLLVVIYLPSGIWGSLLPPKEGQS